jgi:hypothetical protein
VELLVVVLLLMNHLAVDLVVVLIGDLVVLLDKMLMVLVDPP